MDCFASLPMTAHRQEIRCVSIWSTFNFHRVAEARITGGATAASGAGVRQRGSRGWSSARHALLKRGRRGIELTRRAKACSIMPASSCRQACAAISGFAGGTRATSAAHQHFGLSEYLPKAGGLSGPASPSRSTSRRESADIARAIVSSAATWLGGRACCRTIERMPSATTAWCWSPRAGRAGKRRHVDFAK
jgi:hypothetical protein